MNTNDNPKPRDIVIGRKYKLLQRFGQGQFSTVCRGECIRSKTPVAIKMEKNTVIYPLLKHEVNILHYLEKQKCDSIPRVFYYGFQAPYICLVMSFYTNGSLNSWKSRLSLEEITEWWKVAVSTLQSIHKAGIVHRDLKPAHFMRNIHGDWYLIDFGLATTYLDENQRHIEDKPQEHIIGSPLYVSYYVHQGKSVVRRDEYLSLLYILWELLFQNPIGSNPPVSIENIQSTYTNDPYNQWLQNEKEFFHLHNRLILLKERLREKTIEKSVENNDETDETSEYLLQWIRYMSRTLRYIDSLDFDTKPTIYILDYPPTDLFTIDV